MVTNSDAKTAAAATAVVKSSSTKTVARAATGVALTASGKPKEKRRNNEKRKEKSRDAARCRRSRETEIFTELAQVLPLQKEDVNQLDKASIMRLAIVYLKIREMLQLFPKIQELTDDFKIDLDGEDSFFSSSSCVTESSILESQIATNVDLLKCAETSQLIKQTLDGFLLILANDGDITYVSDNITEYLGIPKIDILGQQIWEYTHQCDHADLREALNIKRNGLADKIKDENLLQEGITTDHRDLFVRFKCTLTSRGRSINIKSASYKVIHITGHLVVNSKGDRVLVAIGRQIPHPSNIEIPMETTTFLTKHSLDMKFTYVDDKMLDLFGYTQEDLLEKSLFSCHHGCDSDSLMSTYKFVLSKGQGETCRYRFLGKFGGYCWIVTQATVVYDKSKPQGVVCINYVISNLEKNTEIYSIEQFEAVQSKKKENNNNNDLNEKQEEIPFENKQKLKQSEKESFLINSTTTAPVAAATTSNNLINKNKIDISVKSPLVLIQNSKNCNNNKNNSNNNKNTTPDHAIINNIKKESITSPPIIITTTDTTLTNISSIKPLATKTEIIDKKSIKCEQIPLPLSPLQQNVQQQIIQKRPKSVTASVFLTATAAAKSTTTAINANKIINHNNANNQNNTTNILKPLQLPLNIKTTTTATTTTRRAQSVTASVFTPKSQLANKEPPSVGKQLNPSLNATVLSQQLPQKLEIQQTDKQFKQQQQQQDMNKGFLLFSEDATELTMLKEEPDELSSHLAPTVVDACMPLDDSSPFGEMFMGLINSNNYAYSGLLTDDINSLDSTTSSAAEPILNRRTPTQNCNNNYGNNSNNTSNTNVITTSTTVNSNIINRNSNNSNDSNTNNNHNNNSNSKAGHIDPFINYREESNDTNCSQHLLSPDMASKSPEASSLPSLCSPNSLNQEDDFAFMTMNVDDDIDLTMRAPYIPMNEQEDLPLLTDDLMWCNTFSAEDLNMQKDPDAMQQLQLQVGSHNCEPNRNILSGNGNYQQQFSPASLCSSPASTVSSLSPSPVHQQTLQQQQHHRQQDGRGNVFTSESSELAALLCGAGNGTLSILGNNFDNTDDNDDGSGIVSIDNAQLQQQQQQQQQTHCITVANGNELRLAQLQQQLQEHEQRQQQLLGLSVECKKEKFGNSLATSLCDSIEDAFENVYNKDSTNIDCWSELLQINVNDTTSSSSMEDLRLQQQQQQQLQNCKQNLQLQQLSTQLQQSQQPSIILNAVPLITIQNNKNVLLQGDLQQQHQQQNINSKNNKMMTNEEQREMLNNGKNNRGGGNRRASIKLISSGTATPLATTTPTATIRVVENKLSQQHGQAIIQNIVSQHQQQQQQQQQQQLHGNKRHLASATTAITQLETKRLKSTNVSARTPQLLQQLMTNTTTTTTTQNNTNTTNSLKEQKQQQQQQPQQPQQHPARKVSTNQRWPHVTAADIKSIAVPQQQQSNSVLKNLLISGCDDEPILVDDISLDQTPLSSPPLCVSPSLTKPLHCVTSALRNCSNNPMIGGPGVLPSPPFVVNDDSNPPGLTACDTDSSSDSGIDDISVSGNVSPLKQTEKFANMYFGNTTTTTSSNNSNKNNNNNNNNDFPMKQMLKSETKNLLMMKEEGQTIENDTATADLTLPTICIDNFSKDLNPKCSGSNTNRKTSISFMDSSNPLQSPFLMDLCNDDYNMNIQEYMEISNEIDPVLNVWPDDFV